MAPGNGPEWPKPEQRHPPGGVQSGGLEPALPAGPRSRMALDFEARSRSRPQPERHSPTARRWLKEKTQRVTVRFVIRSPASHSLSGRRRAAWGGRAVLLTFLRRRRAPWAGGSWEAARRFSAGISRCLIHMRERLCFQGTNAGEVYLWLYV